MHDDSVEEIQVSPLVSIGAKLENDATIEQSIVAAVLQRCRAMRSSTSRRQGRPLISRYWALFNYLLLAHLLATVKISLVYF